MEFNLKNISKSLSKNKNFEEIYLDEYQYANAVNKFMEIASKDYPEVVGKSNVANHVAKLLAELYASYKVDVVEFEDALSYSMIAVTKYLEGKELPSEFNELTKVIDGIVYSTINGKIEEAKKSNAYLNGANAGVDPDSLSAEEDTGLTLLIKKYAKDVVAKLFAKNVYDNLTEEKAIKLATCTILDLFAKQDLVNKNEQFAKHIIDSSIEYVLSKYLVDTSNTLEK
ncbi:MAG: hypothetical protein MJ152_04655 [Clostridia bacterium]|nr:hypothetical protein [Clostridia bacterium]